MEWLDIVFELLEDKMIESRNFDGLDYAYYALKGLYGIAELHIQIPDEEILKIINRAIERRNSYCVFTKAKEIEPVILKDGNFIWNTKE